MKPTSIIFLIVSVVLIAAGLATCFIATNVAEADGVAIYAQTLDENNNAVFTSDITNLGITKFEIQVSDCDVNIIGGAETSYVELINFSEGMYSFNITGRIVTLDETPNITDMLKFWENGFKFRGMRHIIRLGSSASLRDKEKAVNIYLAKDEAVKIINAKIGEGDITVDSVLSQTDYHLELTRGTVNFVSVRTTSMVSVYAQECAVIANNSLLRNLTAVIESGSMTTTGLTFSNLDIALSAGDINIEATRGLNNFTALLLSKNGKITVEGEQYDGEYRFSSEKEIGKIELSAGAGDITLNQKTTTDINTEDGSNLS